MASEDEFLSPLVGKRQYLVTYSRANTEIFPTRESFGTAVEEEFNAGPGAVKVDYWACCMEPHETEGIHYHCSIKLTGSKKWKSVKERLNMKYKIQVHFSAKHDYYLSAYRYVIKSDEEVFHSKNHPMDLASKQSPRTKKSTLAAKEANRKRRSESSMSSGDGSSSSSSTNSAAAKRQKKLSNLDVSRLIRKEKINSYKALLALGDERSAAGQDDVSEFIFNRSEKNIREIIKKTWVMNTAKSEIEKARLPRMDIIRSYVEQSPCGEPCDGQWLECAKEVLNLNNIPVSVFASSVRELMEKGRGKHRNILIIGRQNCAKSFILKPLRVIFKGVIFENPADDKFAWIGVDQARVIFLNDFRWNSDVIAWKDLLLLLEGDPVNLPAPKNVYDEDIHVRSDVPIFATSRKEIKYKAPYNVVDETEDEMMRCRWKIFKFDHIFEESKQKKIKPCAKCFVELMFS